MCGRFTLRKTPHEVRSLLGVLRGPWASAHETPLPGDPEKRRYNIAPTQDVLAVRTEADTRTAVWLRWGLVPSGSKSLKVGARMINARSETVFKQPAFARVVRAQRCLIPADGFIEWMTVSKRKHPFHIRLTNGGLGDADVFVMAGLWQRWVSAAGAAVETCAIMTTTANEVVAAVHDRMPVILHPDDYGCWLDPDVSDPARIAPLLKPYPSEGMRAVAIDRRVNDVAHDDPECLAEVTPPPPPAEQLGFGFTS